MLCLSAGIRFSNLSGADFSGADFTESHLRDLVLAAHNLLTLLSYALLDQEATTAIGPLAEITAPSEVECEDSGIFLRNKHGKQLESIGLQ